MANEITVSAQVYVNNAPMRDPFQPDALSVDQAAIGMGGGVQIVGYAADEVISTGDVSTLGWAIFQNLDDTNYVEIGPQYMNGTIAMMAGFIRLEAGEFALLRLKPGITIRGQANTADVKLLVKVYED